MDNNNSLMRLMALHPLGAILAAGFLLGTGALRAGNVPVFRCALEHWPAANFEATVFHRGPLTEEEQALVSALKEAPARSGANFSCVTIDVSDVMDGIAQSRWSSQSNAEPPWLVLHPPRSEPGEPALWTGHLSQQALDGILDSPARRKIAESLLAGDSTAWVLLECGDAIRDEATVDVLAAELQRLEEELRPPSSTNKVAVGNMEAPQATRVKFSLIRVTRNDPAEAFLVSQLLHDEPAHRGRPVAFPIFGRGRVLAGLGGRGLDRESITAACETVCARCKCDISKAHPGKHLLLAAQWEKASAPSAPLEVPARVTAPATNATPSVSSQPASVGTAPPVDKPVEEQRENPFLLITAGLVLTAAIAFAILRPRRGS